MNDLYRQCVERIREISTLSSIGGLLAWDQETMMPERGGTARAEQAAAIAGVVHEKFIDPSLGDMLRTLNGNAAALTPDEAAVVREKLYDYEKSIKLTSELVRELARVSSLAQAAWIKARAQSDFMGFAPWLEKLVDLKRRQADAYGYTDSPYDPLLDDYEPHMTVRLLDPLIDELRRGLVPIATAILHAKTTIDTSFLARSYPAATQEAVCRELMAIIGVDPAASRLDRSAHPFCAGITPPGDVRITTRYDENNPIQAIYGILHESGHALYEQGLEEQHIGTPLGESVSLGIHESQSRLWENVIGRSHAFVTYLFPFLSRNFPEALADIDADTFYRAVNRVQQTPIRVESDEVTYNLHVVLRYEIEQGLIDGTIAVKDLPELWNEKMRTYLEITPRNDAEGVLQDTHWASGLFGYFPTYLLGNLYAAQLWTAIERDVPNANEHIANGRFEKILTWLRQNIHRHGRRYKPTELMQRATGSPITAAPFLLYLTCKYGPLYDIDI